MPDGIQLKRTRGWRMPAGVVKVDRTTKWGNHWHVVWDDEIGFWKAEADYRGFHGVAPAADRPRAARIAVDKFRRDLLDYPLGPMPYGPETVRAELAGRDLACWCGLGEPCHRDVLLVIANEGRT